MPIDGPRGGIRTSDAYVDRVVSFVSKIAFFTDGQCTITPEGGGDPCPRSPERDPGGAVGGKTGGKIGSDSLCFKDVCDLRVNSGRTGGPLLFGQVKALSPNVKSMVSWCAYTSFEWTSVSALLCTKTRPSVGVDLSPTIYSRLGAALRGSV